MRILDMGADKCTEQDPYFLEHLNPAQQILESLAYTYDANGNRISMDRPSVPLPAPMPVSDTAYNAANQMLTFDADDITYDANGNMTSVTNSCGITTYTWDARNRLTGIQGFTSICTSLAASFKYDALGRRLEKTINGRTIKYLYDGKDIVQEIENSAPSVNYIRTLNIDEPLARVQSNGTVRYYQADALGSIIALTDATGAIGTQYSYDAFGNVTITGETSDNPFQYTGRENDETGLYYYRARYYSPKLQRFISEDPIGLKGGDINFFVYSKNNPILFIDPSGLCKWTGSLSLNTYGTPIFGGGYIVMGLQSNCCNNQMASGAYFVIVGGLTIGRLPVQATSQMVELDGPDTPSDQDPVGAFAYISAGISITTGPSYSIIRSGSLFGYGPSLYYGLDLGIDGLFGTP